MLLLDFQITQKDDKSLIFKDITPEYSAQTPNGYGGLNALPSEIIEAVITLDFGGNRGIFNITTTYIKGRPDLVIKAEDLPAAKPIEHGCTDCDPYPYGCDSCDDSRPIERDCNGHLTGFPSGCITVRYEVFTFNSVTEKPVSVGLKVKQITSAIKEINMFLDLADRMTLPNTDARYKFFRTTEERQSAMRELALIWVKIGLLDKDLTHCDCDCIASRIKQINSFLKSTS